MLKRLPASASATISSTSRRAILWIRAIFLSLSLSSGVACNDLTKQDLPAGVPDPNTFATPSGAMALYNAARYTFETATSGSGDVSSSLDNGQVRKLAINGVFVDVVFASGLLSDELQPSALGGTSLQYFNVNMDWSALDARLLPESKAGDANGANSYVKIYDELHTIRAMSNQAIGALAAHAPATSPALRGYMYALQGYAEIFLGDLFCSGVPLTTLDYNGDITYRPGSTTSEIYEHAVTRFDSALAVSSDSVNIQYLAQVGKGRALLAEGRFADAALTVETVPDNFAYRFSVNWGNGFGTATATAGQLFTQMNVTASDSEGINGIAYLRSGDPRSDMVPIDTNQFGLPQYFPRKYAVQTSSSIVNVNGTTLITVADGIEARLIQAEAALHAGDIGGWLTFLSRARTLATPTGATLPALTDPGDSPGDSARVTVMFRERALDLFVTGHRQGDMRRLIRQYGRNAETVYPTGGYPGYVPSYQASLYGSDVNAPVPQDEQSNPLFHGCFGRGA
jgi:hypothetical protein